VGNVPVLWAPEKKRCGPLRSKSVNGKRHGRATDMGTMAIQINADSFPFSHSALVTPFYIQWVLVIEVAPSRISTFIENRPKAACYSGVAAHAPIRSFTHDLRTGLSTGSTLQYPRKTHYLVVAFLRSPTCWGLRASPPPFSRNRVFYRMA
jgi:hypothetical protein